MEEYKSSSGYTKKEKIILTAAAVVILAATAGSSFWFYQKFKPSKEEKKISIVDMIRESKGKVEKRQVEEIQEVKVAEKQPEKEKTISPAEIMVKIYNGGAVAGSAGKMKEILVSSGYAKTEAGNAKGNYEGLVVCYEEKLEKEAQDLKEILKSKYTTIEIKKGLPEVEGVASGILIVLGK